MMNYLNPSHSSQSRTIVHRFILHSIFQYFCLGNRSRVCHWSVRNGLGKRHRNSWNFQEVVLQYEGQELVRAALCRRFRRNSRRPLFLVFWSSGVRALPVAAGTNEGGHYFRYFFLFFFFLLLLHSLLLPHKGLS